MHYRDGTEAKLGDLVKGTGYNVKHEVQGVVVGLVPGSTSCNLRVAYLCPAKLYAWTVASELVFVETRTEYGQCDAFELVHRAA